MPHLEAQFGPLNKKRSQAKKTNEVILSVFPAAVAALTPPSAQNPQYASAALVQANTCWSRQFRVPIQDSGRQYT